MREPFAYSVALGGVLYAVLSLDHLKAAVGYGPAMVVSGGVGTLGGVSLLFLLAWVANNTGEGRQNSKG